MNLYQKALQYEQNKKITIREHPQFKNLFILNYTHQLQYSNDWDEFTMMCRGLIIDIDGNIIARPFTKFFNYQEIFGERFKNNSFLQAIQNNLICNVRDNSFFQVAEKLDGQLGILYVYDNTPCIATRGSFESPQAIEGTKILNEKYIDFVLNHLEDFKRNTWLFEIIHPEGRVVIDYGNERDLYLLDIICINSAQSVRIENIYQNIPFKKPIDFHYDSIKKLMLSLEDNDVLTENQEGFVVKFCNGLRVKIKFKEYLELHKIITRLNEKTIWQLLKDGIGIDNLLSKLPEEHIEWVEKVANDLNDKYREIETDAFVFFHRVQADFMERLDPIERKEWALKFKAFKYPSILFNIYDDKDYSQIIWKIIEP